MLWALAFKVRVALKLYKLHSMRLVANTTAPSHALENAELENWTLAPMNSTEKVKIGSWKLDISWNG